MNPKTSFRGTPDSPRAGEAPKAAGAGEAAALRPPDSPDAGTAAAANGHGAQFYESEAFLLDRAGAFASKGLRQAEPVILIVTAERRDGIHERIAKAGFDVEAARSDGRLTTVDARDALSAIMDGAVPDRPRFRQVVGRVIEERVRANGGRAARTYGEMVDVLWRESNPEGALRLEALWNELAAELPFTLLCAYSMDHFHRESDALAFEEVCRAHAHVIPAESYWAARDADERAREFSRLQQRATALEAEVDHRRKLEATLRALKDEAERAHRVKSEFLAVMSHELRTPLNAIIGYEELLRNDVGGTTTPEQRRYLHGIRRGAQQLIRLVDQVLSLSRLEAGKEDLRIETVDLGALARETAAFVEPMAAAKGLDVAVRESAGTVRRDTDPDKVMQILLNLLANAVKFTAEGGVRVEIRRDGPAAVVSVADTGPGIPARDHERIFRPFVQAHEPGFRPRGAGLGLAVSRDLARLLGGDVTVESAPGEGSTFALRLPAA